MTKGGTDNEEFRVAAVLDRVNTTWEALLGTTFACVQCHSHPYDPFRHEDYYRFMAFFNDTRDEDTYDDYPRLRHFDSLQTAQYQQLNQWMDTYQNQKQAIDHFIQAPGNPPTIHLRCDDFSNQSSPIPNGWPCAITAAPGSPMFTCTITKTSSCGWYYIVLAESGAFIWTNQTGR
ncbi:MAG: DUF1549 domain-containing protein [Lewinellaceae bacterium]|nr:DUF1549 domain-containing protein [Lewinellaceae bacterium]